MKAIIITCLMLTAGFQSFAQSCLNIKKVYAYYNASMPGIQMVDDNGNPITPKPNITRFIYLEYSGTKMPDIKAVLYNAEPLVFSVVNVKDKMISVGDKNLNSDNSITAKKGNSFLKIDLQPADGKTMPDGGCKSIVIKNKVGNKICRFYVASEKEFATQPMY
jgi:hypothetical protein